MSEATGGGSDGGAPSGLDALVVAHMAQVRRLCLPGGPLSTNADTATTNNPAWFQGSEVSPARQRLHGDLVEAANARAGVDQEPHAIVMAGPPGAGKSTVRVPFMASEGLDPASYTVVDADHFKEALVHAALRDGSYERFIKPDEVRRLEARGERFFPLEISALLHQESGLLARQQQSKLLKAGANVIIDTVLSDPDKAALLGRALEANGYTVTVLDVEVGAELSRARIEHRWALAYREALTGLGTAGGGRWVPSEFARKIFDGPEGPGGPSRSEVAAARLAEGCPAVLRYQVLRTAGGAERALVGHPELVVDRAFSVPGETLMPVTPEGRQVVVRTPPHESPVVGRIGVGQGDSGLRVDPPSLSLAERMAQRAQERNASSGGTPEPRRRLLDDPGEGPSRTTRPHRPGPTR